MARRTSSFGFLGRFGRSEDLRRLDGALRAVDLHPNLVPEGAKLALVNMMKDHLGDVPPLEAYAPAAAIFAYCALGSGAFAHANGDAALEDAERRVDAALSADGMDADIVLLAHHAKLMQPEIRARHGIEIEN
ncbi:MAG: hypothetical protein WBF87_02645 [Mesorhizobium sp.]